MAERLEPTDFFKNLEVEPVAPVAFLAFVGDTNQANPERIVPASEAFAFQAQTAFQDPYGYWEFWRVVPDRDGFVVVPMYGWPLWRFKADGTLDWTFDDLPDFASFWLGWDAAVDGQGNAFFLWPPYNSVHKLDASGAQTWVASDEWAERVGGYEWGRLALTGYPVSVALSADASVIYLLYQGVNVEEYHVIGISAADATLLWDAPIATDGYLGLASREASTIRTIPGSDDFYVRASREVGAGATGYLSKWIFADGPTAAPTFAWGADWHGDPASDFAGLSAMHVTAEAVTVGGDAAQHTGQAEPHLAVRYDHDGNLLWRYQAANFLTDGSFVGFNSLGELNGRVILGVVSDAAEFATPSRSGFVLLDSATGERVSEGDFPYPTDDWPYAVAVTQGAEAPSREAEDFFKILESEPDVTDYFTPIERPQGRDALRLLVIGGAFLDMKVVNADTGEPLPEYTPEHIQRAEDVQVEPNVGAAGLVSYAAGLGENTVIFPPPPTTPYPVTKRVGLERAWSNLDFAGNIDIALSRDGSRLLVKDNFSVSVIDTATGIQTPIVGLLKDGSTVHRYQRSIHWTPNEDGFFVLNAAGTRRLNRFDLAGNLVWGSGVTAGLIAVIGEHVFTAGGGTAIRKWRVDTGAEVVGAFPKTLTGTTHVVAGVGAGEGKLFAISNRTVVCYDAESGAILYASPDVGAWLYGIGTDEEGRVYVGAENGDGRVFCLDPSGNTLWESGNVFSGQVHRLVLATVPAEPPPGSGHFDFFTDKEV